MFILSYHDYLHPPPPPPSPQKNHVIIVNIFVQQSWLKEVWKQLWK